MSGPVGMVRSTEVEEEDINVGKSSGTIGKLRGCCGGVVGVVKLYSARGNVAKRFWIRA